jgi:hypothetical protein
VTRAAPSPSNTALEAPDLDLTGRVGGIPAAARQHFEELLRRPLQSRSSLLDRARTHLADLERASSQNEFVEVSLARRLLELYERLLDHTTALSPATQRIAQSAVLYFISTDDAEDDFELAGLDDDKAVLDAVLKHLELDWS